MTKIDRVIFPVVYNDEHEDGVLHVALLPEGGDALAACGRSVDDNDDQRVEVGDVQTGQQRVGQLCPACFAAVAGFLGP